MVRFAREGRPAQWNNWINAFHELVSFVVWRGTSRWSSVQVTSYWV